MTVDSARKSSREKVAEHRTRLRAAGLRPVQIWLPDTRSETLPAEALRQSRAVAASAHSEDDQAFIDAISEFPEE